MGTNHDRATAAEIRGNLGENAPTESGTFRIIVCIDVDAADLATAYAAVRRGMDASGLEYESSDEWYRPDGEQGDADELSAARLSVLGGEKLFACHVCGCTDVETLDWVDVNTGKLTGGDPCGENFCPQCDANGDDGHGVRLVEVDTDAEKPFRAEGS